MRQLGLLGAAAILMAACGSDPEQSNDGGGGGPSYAPCEVRASSGSVSVVDLAVDSPLPDELGALCASSDPAQLDAMLLIPNQPACMLTVSASGAQGCCPGVTANQNPVLTLVYRVFARTAPVGEQLKTVELPTTSQPVVPLSFAGTPLGNFDQNRTSWCSGAW